MGLIKCVGRSGSYAQELRNHCDGAEQGTRLCYQGKFLAVLPDFSCGWFFFKDLLKRVCTLDTDMGEVLHYEPSGTLAGIFKRAV